MAETYPRLEDLTYRLQMGDSHELAANACLEGELVGFRFKLEHQTATFYPLQHFASEVEARAVLEPQLKAWEIHNALRHGKDAMRFKFLAAFVQPEPPRPNVAYLHGVATMALVGSVVTVKITHAKHPAPPVGFVVNDCVQDLAAQFLQSRETPGVLLKNAYSMVSRMEFEFRGLPAAARALRISLPVLRKIRSLSSQRGTGAEVRKFERSVALAALTLEEREWLLRLLELMVRRAGAVAAGAPVGDEITLATMPAPPSI